MVSGKVTVKNPTGLHLRPAGTLCKQQCNLNHLLHSTTEMEIQQMQRAS